MHKYLPLIAFLLVGLTAGAQMPALPETPKRPVIDTYFGKKVTDNYRWLEDMSSPETQAWFKAQGAYTDAVLARISGRDKLIQTFVDYDKMQTAQYTPEGGKRGNTYFYRKTLPGDNAGKLYMREGWTGAETLLFDPAAYDPSKNYLMTAFTPSPDGKKMAIGLQEGGAELSTVRVLDIATKTFGSESLPAVFYGQVEWLPDNSGLLYLPYNSADTKDTKGYLDTKTRLHRLGTNPANDAEIFSRAKYPNLGLRPNQFPTVSFSDDHSQIYGFLYSVDRRIDAFVASPTELTNPTIAWKRLLAVTDSVYEFAKVGNRLFLHSVKGASKGQILVTDAQNPTVAAATVLLPEGAKNMTRLLATKDFLFVTLNDGINDQIRQFDTRTNQWADVPIPGSGTMGIIALDASNSNDVLAFMISWNQPVTAYNYDPDSKKIVINPLIERPNYPGLADMVVEEIEIPGHDGVAVPLSLIYKKGLKRDGSAVCFMTGYGAYGTSARPYFNVLYLPLLNQGVILAETHPRGGAEKGQDWHRAGFKTTKANTWKDFISSGEYLVKNGYTSPRHLIGEGTSAGGILIGRAITERPDLFAAAINNVSVSNPLRMEETPNGPRNAPELGTVKDSVEAMALYEMDAFQHVKDGTKYPAVICIGGMNDPRVIAWQPGKFAAALQNATTSGKPVLMQVNYDNGHFTEDKTVTYRNFANMYAFALWQAGHPAFQPIP